MDVITNSPEGHTLDITFNLTLINKPIRIINNQLVENYPGERTDKKWRAILVDKYCSVKQEYQRNILKLLLLEGY